jgi:hypothetical protein
MPAPGGWGFGAGIGQRSTWKTPVRVLRPRNQGQRAGELLVATTLDPNLAVGGPGALAVAFWQVNWERPGGGSAWPLNRTASAHFGGTVSLSAQRSSGGRVGGQGKLDVKERGAVASGNFP